MHEMIRLTLPNDLAELARVNESARSFLEQRGVGPEMMYVTHLALEEILSNVIRYGYDDRERHEISVCLRAGDGTIELQVVDDGREFDPLSAPPVDVAAPLEERRVGGLGIHLLRTLTSEILYRRADGRNHLKVRIRRAS
jgi:serine/threonine-protein kinase RsbW